MAKDHVIVVDAQASFSLGGTAVGCVFVAGAVAGFVAGYQVAEKIYATEKEIEAQWRRTKFVAIGTAGTLAAVGITRALARARE